MSTRTSFRYVLGFTLACGALAPWSPAAASSGSYRIVNGEPESEFPFAAAIGAEINESRLAICSASLITPRLVLTAAHCGAMIPEEVITGVGAVFFGESVATADQLTRVEGFEAHPEYVPLSNGGVTEEDLGRFDIAIVTLLEDAPVDPVWIRMDPLTEEEVVGSEVISIGYGLTETGSAADSGVKRSANLVLDELDDMFLVSQSSTNPASANVCSGDSGGPQYARDGDRWVQWGVHSWGDEECTFLSGSTRVDLAADWILDKVEEVHGTRDLCEAHGLYSDGVCEDLPYCDAVDTDCLDDRGGKGACSTGPVPWSWPGLVLAFGLVAARRIRGA